MSLLLLLPLQLLLLVSLYCYCCGFVVCHFCNLCTCYVLRVMCQLSFVICHLSFVRCVRHLGVHFHERLEVAMVTHVDDLPRSGAAVNLEWVRAKLSKKYELKGELMKEVSSEVKFLGRTIGRNDHKHRNILLEQSWNGVSTRRALRGESEVDMLAHEATTYRWSATRLNYLAQDRSDTAVGANFLARSMAHPVYLKAQRCRLNFVFLEMPNQVTVLSDSDWASYPL